MTSEPRRRWFRFSLRTMLVLVTVVCVYLGWAMNWIRQRREYLRESNFDSGIAIFTDKASDPDLFSRWTLFLLNEPRVKVFLVESMEEQELLKISRLFPEAKVLFCNIHKQGVRYKTELPGIYAFSHHPKDLPYYQNGVLFHEETLERVESSE